MSGTCRICGNTEGNVEHYAKEMMFGMKDEFLYFECGNCGCLQISNIPNCMEKYYPSNYYSYKTSKHTNLTRLDRFLASCKSTNVLNGSNLIGQLLNYWQPATKFPAWFKEVKPSLDSKVLDVGCGEGSFLSDLESKGFNNLTGVDPYIRESKEFSKRFRIIKCELEQLESKYDVIVLSHSFEHMADQKKVISALSNLLEENGTVVIRIPVVSGYAWRHYKTNWVQLDAPRHFYLHTEKSMNLVAQQGGFTIYKTEYDSSMLQFWGSEQYLKGIPLADARSLSNGRESSVFSSEEIESFKARAKSLNRKKDGDQANFFLKKAKPKILS